MTTPPLERMRELNAASRALLDAATDGEREAAREWLRALTADG